MKKENKFKLIIFDFDGTISDSFDLCFDSINKILKNRGAEAMTEREKQEARNLSAREVFRYFGIPVYQLPFVVKKIFETMRKGYSDVKVFVGMKKVLRTLNSKGFRVVILTSNIKSIIEDYNKNNNIDVFFEETYHNSGLFSKHLIINKIIKKYKVKKSEVVMLGDEVRDIEAAQKSEIKMIAVDWGFNSRKALENSSPDYLVSKPSEILEIIKNQ